MSNTKFSSVSGFAEVQAALHKRGIEMAFEAIEANDIAYLYSMREDMVNVLNFTIECVEKRYDYLTWRAGSIYINRNSKLIQLDSTGEVKRLMDLCDGFDAQRYYEVEVTKHYNTPVDLIRAGGNVIIEEIDGWIAELRKKLTLH